MASGNYRSNKEKLTLHTYDWGRPDSYGRNIRFTLVGLDELVDLALEELEEEKQRRGGKLNVDLFAPPLNSLACQAHALSSFLAHFDPMGQSTLPLGFSMEMVDLMDSFLETLSFYAAFGAGLDQGLIGRALLAADRPDLMERLATLEKLYLGGITQLFDLEVLEDAEDEESEDDEEDFDEGEGEGEGEDDYEDDEDDEDDDDDPDVIPFKPKK